MSASLTRPKTAGAGQLRGNGLQDLPAGTTVGGHLPKRPGSQMSHRAAAAAMAANDSSWPQYVPIRRVPSAMRRHIEIQTEATSPQAGQDHSISGGGLFYPYYVPGMQADQSQQQQQAGAAQPFVLLSPWQLPGYQSLPVLDAAQLKMLEPVMGRPASAHPLDGTPIYRSGRNGSCWRHIRQCTGNLGNNIMFIDGHVKEEDCRRFPPHGYPGASSAGLSVFNRLAPKAQPRITAAGIPLGYPGAAGARQLPIYTTQAMERAKSGAKYWYEDRKGTTLVPNTIQGRIMKSGSAY